MINQTRLIKLIQAHAQVDAIYLYGSRAKQTAHKNTNNLFISSPFVR